MPRIFVCFVWHMHQPFYKDLVSGEYKLPWTRMHALKDYYGMVRVLEDFPDVRQTFNLVPSMLAQVEDYASGAASDPFLRAALRPAEELDDAGRQFLLRYFFQANPQRMIYRYRRYGELYDAWQEAGHELARARHVFTVQGLRDLQVLSQLAWFDEEFHARDPEIRELTRKERGYSLEDQALIGRKQQQICGMVLPAYREFAERGQIEISATPFYHPILPLLCDSQIAEISHPYALLPTRFRHPEDASHQLLSARRYMEEKFGKAPAGLWPSEGSVSDEAMALAHEAGFRWFASDNGVLAHTLRCAADPGVTYKPYVWRREGREMHCIFRDHHLSDLIGFVYSRMNAEEAASHFLAQIRANCEPFVQAGRDALVPIILDGENAWEHYEESGRPFLRELYRRLSNDSTMRAVTVSEALALLPAEPIGGIFPGSWINANFDIWIGAEEDNKAWELLARARKDYERVRTSPEWESLPRDRRLLAHEELMIAEGSDWCWWYGPEHDSANRPEFDQLFRSHLANVYLALRLRPPDELSRPILRTAETAFHQKPSGPVRATIDGRATSYFEWMGAGVYRADGRSGAMHGKQFVIQELHYGTDGHNLYLRLDPGSPLADDAMEFRLQLEARATASLALPLQGTNPAWETAYARIWEARIALGAAGLDSNYPLRFQLSLWQRGLPVDALPEQGWIELSSAEPADWAYF